jgi:hypothetical protein
VRAYTLQATFPKNRYFLGFINSELWISGFWYFLDFEGGSFGKIHCKFCPILALKNHPNFSRSWAKNDTQFPVFKNLVKLPFLSVVACNV